MFVDRYTKVVLTVIALCLVWLSVGGPSVAPPVQAQGGNREVEVKRVNVGSAQATTQTLGVPVGISCLEVHSGVECFVVSTR